jgi:hypothetical protein
MMLVLNLVNTTGEFILGKTVSRLATEMVASGQTGRLSEEQVKSERFMPTTSSGLTS